MLDFIKKIMILFTSSYQELILVIFYFILVSFFQSRDKKDDFKPKLLILVLCFSYLVNIFYVFSNQNIFLNGKLYGIILFYILSLIFYLFRDKILEKHQLISKFFIILILSIIFIFTVSTLTPVYYLLLCNLFILFIGISYSHKKNVKVFLYTSIFLLINLFCFILKKWDTVKKCEINIVSISFLLYTVFLLLVSLISALFLKHEIKYNINKNNKLNLFSERFYDLERITEYIKHYNLIGINSDWGNGKTFLFEMLKNQEKNNYDFINISVLTMRTENVEAYVINEICNILERNRIFTQSSKKIKGLFKQSFFHSLGETFFVVNSYNETIDKLGIEVLKLGHPIIITFEDIDRITDKDLIYKIFALADVLKSEEIKIIFQYEEQKLLEILDVDKSYIEKYIQHSLTLTTLSFETMLKKFLQKEKYKLLKIEDFNFLRFPIHIPQDLNKILCIHSSFYLEIFNCQIRKFEIFLDDIIQALANENFKTVDNYKQIIILFYFIKHFDYDCFNCLKDTISFTELKIFCYKDEYYSIIDLINNVYHQRITNDDLNSLLQNERNRNRMIFYILFGYNFEIIFKNIKHDEVPSGSREFVLETLTQKSDEIQAHNKNEKINRIIKNLIGSGKSENTDFENAVKEMNSRVLNLPKDKQEEGYKELSKIMYNENFQKSDNQTIFRFGLSGEFSLFQAYLIYENSYEQWNKLIDFFITADKKIDSHLIQILNYCKIENKKVFLHVLDLFSKLQIIGNLNKTISYKNFIYTYLNAIMIHGYSRMEKLHWVSKEGDNLLDTDFFVNHIIPDCLKDLSDLRNISDNSVILNEITVIENFVKHNCDLMKNGTDLTESIPEIKTSSTIHDSIADKSEEYKKMRLTKKELQNILDEQYLKGEINLYEYRCFINNVFGKGKH